MTNKNSTPLHALKNELAEKRVNLTYDELAAIFGVNKYYLWMILNREDYQPPARIRHLLGLPTTAPIIVTVDVPPGTQLPPNAVIIQCANPACAVWFVRVHPRQRYHDKQCRIKRKKDEQHA